jgi:hypothetical protein
MAFHQDLFNCQRTRLTADRQLQLTRECCARTASSFGGADWNRTSDPLLAKQVLSQLSYSPTERETPFDVAQGRELVER